MDASRTLPASLLAILLAATPLAAQYDPAALQYQNRGNRHEGLRTLPISGYDIALLSARIDYREEAQGWPDDLRVLFYLPQADGVHVTVRQLRSKLTYYWLDKVKPAPPWQAQALNEFAWPTAPVLGQLRRLKIDNLGTVIRLGSSEPGEKEIVAPAILYGSRLPPSIDAYRFTLKTNGAAHVTCTVYRDAEKVFERPETGEKAGRPFTVRWLAAGEPEGWYRLVLSGYFDDDNVPLQKEVRYFHSLKVTR